MEFKRPPIIHAGAVEIFLDDMGTKYEENIRVYLKDGNLRLRNKLDDTVHELTTPCHKDTLNFLIQKYILTKAFVRIPHDLYILNDDEYELLFDR